MKKDLNRRLWRVALSPIILFTTIGTVFRSPLILLKKVSQHVRGKRKFLFQPEIYSLPTITPELVNENKAAGTTHVAFLGPTYGEFRMMHAIADRLLERNPEIRITYCLRDSYSIDTIRKKYPSAAMAMVPSPFLPVIIAWLRQVQPDLVIFAESSQPLTAYAAKKFGARTALVNGRYRKRSKWKQILRPKVLRWRSRSYNAILFQNEENYQNAKPWAAETSKLVITGNVKIDLTEKNDLTKDPELLAWLELDCGPIFVAGSTEHVDEETMAIKAFAKVRQRFPCRLLIAPRKISNATAAVNLAAIMGFRVSRRTKPESNPEILILDTLGELATIYQYCVAAYVGGSYGDFANGHNVLEPAEWGIPISYGLRRGHFGDIQKLCEEAGVSARIQNSDDLASHWTSMLANPEERERLSEKCRHLISQNTGAIDRAVTELGLLL